MRYGTDPEFFSIVKDGNKNFVISPALLEITRQITPINDDIKHPIYIRKDDFSWMMDGVAWELTLSEPQNSAEQMHKIINDSLECLEEFITKLEWNGSKLKLYKKPVVDINPQDYIPNLNLEKVYQGFIFGCDPDEDGIIENYKCDTVDVFSHPYRYGGGHIHFSGNNLMYENPRIAVQLLAITVGNYVTANSLFPKLDKLRVKTYGKPGRFRPQEYKNGDVGIEYRTPSNSWTSFSLEKKIELISLAEYASKIISGDVKYILEFINNFLPRTIESINNADSDLAKEILKEI